MGRIVSSAAIHRCCCCCCCCMVNCPPRRAASGIAARSGAENLHCTAATQTAAATATATAKRRGLGISSEVQVVRHKPVRIMSLPLWQLLSASASASPSADGADDVASLSIQRPPGFSDVLSAVRATSASRGSCWRRLIAPRALAAANAVTAESGGDASSQWAAARRLFDRLSEVVESELGGHVMSEIDKDIERCAPLCFPL